MPLPGAGTQSDISGMVARLSDGQRQRYRVRAGDSTGRSRRPVNTTGSARPGGQGPKGGAPVWSYSWGGPGLPQPGSGWNTPPDISRFADVFQPSGGLFAPGYPLVPVERERLRQWDFPVGYNYIYTPRSYEPVSFKELRALSTEPMTRVCIETRKDQVGALEWTVRSRDEKNPKSDAKTRSKTLNKFFEKPDGYHSFDTWLRWQLEEVMVTDAPAVEVRRNRGGDVIGLDYLDGATIKVLVDDTGRRPVPPAPAYEQIIHGRPWVLAEDGRVDTEDRGNPIFDDQIVYFPRNSRGHKVYGFSPCEQIILTINTALRRQIVQLQHFTDSNVPNGIITAAENWTADQILAFQEWFDGILSGNTARRTSAIWVPSGAKYQAFKEAPFKDGFDEWLARIISYAFSLPPTPFVQVQNRATAAVVQEVSREEGLAPLKQWVKVFVDNIIQDRIGHTDLEFSWVDEPPIDSSDQAKVFTGYVADGVMTRNEAREELGLAPIDGGDDATVQVPGKGVLLVADLAEMSEATVAAPPPGTANGAPPRQTSGKPRPSKNRAAKAAGRVTKEIAEYTHAGTQERCRACSMFEAPDACGRVIGVISPDAHCRFWEAKLGAVVSRMLKAGHIDPENAVPVDDYFPLADQVDLADVWHIAWGMVRAGEGDNAGYELDRRTVPVSRLRATQSVVDKGRVAKDERAYRAQGQDPDELPLAVERGGLIYVVAGHHHVSGAIVAGADELDVQIMVPAPEPEE